MKLRFPATPLTHTSGVPTQALVALLELTDIRVSRDMEAINQATQLAWRKPDLQAAQIVEEHAHLAEQAAPLFRALGLTGVPVLQPGKRQWTILLGATYLAMHKRTAHAVNLMKDTGVSWLNTAMLVSKRPLFNKGPHDKESTEVITNPVAGGLPFRKGWEPPTSLVETEAELVPFILSQVGHHYPWDASREHTVIADDVDGKPANTVGTLRAFADQLDPRGDTLLVVSSQPHMLRQGIEAAKVLGDRFTTYEVTGYDMPGTTNVTQKLDELAKLIFLLAQE